MSRTEGRNIPHLPPGRTGFDALTDAARREYRVNRTDAPYTDAQLGRLRQDLLDHRCNTRDRRGKVRSWEWLSDNIGVAASTLNQWAHGKYEGDDQRLARRVDEYLADEQARKGRLAIGGYRNIANAGKALAVMQAAVRDNEIAAIIGPSGCGKTEVMFAFASQRSGALALTIGENSATAAGVTTLLLQTVFAADGQDASGVPRNDNARRWSLLLDYFRRNRSAVLLVDEAQKMHKRGLEVLRDLHDQSDPARERRLPIILFGDARFYRLILASRAGRSCVVEPQLARRITYCYDYERDGAATPGGPEMFTAEDLVQVLRNDRLRLVDAEGLRYLTRLANVPGEGHLGLVVSVVRKAAAITRQTPFSLDVLRAALRMTPSRRLAEELAVEDDTVPARAARTG